MCIARGDANNSLESGVANESEHEAALGISVPKLPKVVVSAGHHFACTQSEPKARPPCKAHLLWVPLRSRSHGRQSPIHRLLRFRVPRSPRLLVRRHGPSLTWTLGGREVVRAPYSALYGGAARHKIFFRARKCSSYGKPKFMYIHRLVAAVAVGCVLVIRSG